MLHSSNMKVSMPANAAASFSLRQSTTEAGEEEEEHPRREAKER